ncbi:class 1b ribonucleoside-diphosphate reductase subunit beta [Paraclostridium bifermentans]|jgi:ribonucleoside-diphosphate reductase beta chain|uniref:Ribonucleoside-diphosphate reductase subunit beta n=1 Tax=Paraclostridium bifermentans ATCC 638 = DSM 14991 TaxID=1233171 RepID=T4VMH0_PARBF|nr:class 1b ribonucleoside-diphosphate reductase subunit beta [Paraclostridium bifermentans]RDC49507.1 class 1b ribonucleoside-diphosphate reductase subunit beta [Acinetobacter sp. RIT592]EQK42678.1 ribonucleotide reductase, small chain family protein [[Clostridium] bifermentans ATCC 638] [Paraclostridium bifermentans ATCC 638 = DSM 14991]MBU5288086.1 class 1b ribonucleoside-diphosphate reductase subunit beta [Paraclostridium bifermentans]MDU3336978.1 class 1b ribonucleoside-diphosphate reducta
MTFNSKSIHKAVNWNVEDDGFTQAFWDQNVKQFWLPEEISVSKDLKTWADLSESEKELYKKVLAGLTLLDTKQGNNGVPSMMSLTDNLQRKAVLSFMGTMEEIHAKSYSSIFMTLLTTPQIEELFNWIETEPTLQKKAELILDQYENTNDQRSLYLSMVTSVFLESFLFYSGFFYPLYLAGQGKMVASGEIISLILRDESLHGKYIGLLAQEIYDSFKEEDKLVLKEKIYKIFKDLMDNEIEYTKKIYNGSGLVEEVITFLQYNANRALENLGFDKYYEVGEINPIVLNGLSTETKSHDFFSTKGNGYQKGIYEELEDEDFII